ncbi:MAG: glutamine amidotransferase [Sebaldella sp.]|nr:glutamine amidotransferase [Sebaldella sp.]
MKTVLLLLTDQFADWEAAYVSPELNKKDGKYKIKVITEDNKPKISMGGVTVIPESGIDDCKIDDNIAMLIIPGGETWLENKSEKIKGIIKDCFEKNIPVAAICNAVTFLAENGFLEKNKHTGNSVEYIKACAPNYKGEQNYINKQAVRDGNLITANGSAAVEFSREILEKLEVFDENKLKEWYNTFKKGYL